MMEWGKFKNLKTGDDLYRVEINEDLSVKLIHEKFNEERCHYFLWETTAEKAIEKFLETQKEEHKRLGKVVRNAERLASENGVSLSKAEQDAVIKEDTQWYRVMKYIEENGSISPKEAFNELGITKLATRISELKARGFKFKQKREKGENRFNEPVCYMRYFEYKEENNV